MKKLMKLLAKKILTLIAALAIVITTMGVNTACWYVMNQDELPRTSKKLRKF